MDFKYSWNCYFFVLKKDVGFSELLFDDVKNVMVLDMISQILTVLILVIIIIIIMIVKEVIIVIIVLNVQFAMDWKRYQNYKNVYYVMLQK